MNTSVRPSEPLAMDATFDDVSLHVRLRDGREIAVPLEWYPKLRDADDAARNDWRLIGQGVGIHWNRLDEDLSVAGMLAG